jgi:hypothetical protein
MYYDIELAVAHVWPRSSSTPRRGDAIVVVGIDRWAE